jgi:hypothetical protein
MSEGGVNDEEGKVSLEVSDWYNIQSTLHLSQASTCTRH